MADTGCALRLDADQLQADWEHALDVAAEAVEAGRRSKALGHVEAASMAHHIRDERRWLQEFSPTMHNILSNGHRWNVGAEARSGRR